MMNQTTTKLILRSSIALALALVIWSPIRAQTAKPAANKMMMKSEMMERCQEMKKQKQQMMENMKAQDAELTEQVAIMNSAQGEKQVSLMAAVVTRMVEQRTAMHARMADMQQGMMKHMMEHMQMGKESMPQCPMMEGMDDRSGAARKERQSK